MNLSANKEILKLGSLTFLIFLLVTIPFLFRPVSAEETVKSLEELPPINYEISLNPTNNEITLTRDIAILYKQKGENNISLLNIERSKIESAKKLNDYVDVIRVSNEVNANELLSQIENNENVEAASFDTLIKPLEALTRHPNDPYYNYLYHLGSVGAGNNWSTLSGGNEVKVAVVDTGVMTTHEDLQGIVEKGSDYSTIDGNEAPEDNYDPDDPIGHGTGVASVIAAQVNNEKGIAGVCGTGNIKIVSYKFLPSRDKYGTIYGSVSSTVAAFMDILDRGDIKIVNYSAGETSQESNMTILKKACDLLRENGIILFASAGNTGGSVSYPAKYDSVIAVAATNKNGTHAVKEDWINPENQEEFQNVSLGSCFGPEIDLAAPGTDILVAAPPKYVETQDPSKRVGDDFNYMFGSGTSYSSPMAAGICAVLWSKYPQLDSEQIREILFKSAQDLEEPGKDIYTGYGMVRLDKALELAESYLPNDSISFKTPNTPLLVQQTYQLNAHSVKGSDLVFTSSDPYIAQVSETGLIKAVNPGSAEITISVKNNPNISKTLTITVNPLSFTAECFIQNTGWTNPIDIKNNVIGTTGKSLPIFALKLSSNTPGIILKARSFVNGQGWSEPQEILGNPENSEPLQALVLTPEGENVSLIDIFYRVHLSNQGWTQWVQTNEPVGTTDPGNMIEAVELKAVYKGYQPYLPLSDLNWSFKGTY